MPKATYDDVTLILRLYELRQEETLRKARAWFSKSFKPKTMAEVTELCPVGYETNHWMRQVITYWDMAASFVVTGVLNEELFFDNSRELLVVWLRVRPFIEEMRIAYKNPQYWSSLEKAGKAYIAYWERTVPGAYEAFNARMGG